MDLGKPLEIVEVDLAPTDTPAPYEGEPTPVEAPTAPEKQREEELIPA